MKKILVVLCVLSALSLMANEADYFRPNFNLMPTINPNKLTIGHTLSFSSGISSNYTSNYESKYTNHISYEFSPKLSIQVDLSIVNYGMTNFNKDFSIESNGNNDTKLIPEFRMDWKPTENSSVTIEFKRYNGYNSPRYWY